MSARIRDAIIRAGVAVLLVAWLVVQGATVREAIGIGIVGGALAGIAVTIGNRVIRRGPLRHLRAAALTGTDLIVRADEGVRARRLADGGEAPAPSSVPDGDADEIQLELSVDYGGSAAKLWFEGRHRLALHGLQPKPPALPEFIDGMLMVTRAITTRTEGFPIFVRHRSSLATDADHLLTLLGLDGSVRWTATFAAPGLANAKFLFAQPDRVVLVTSSRDDGSEAIVLDAATGRLAWRRRL